MRNRHGIQSRRLPVSFRLFLLIDFARRMAVAKLCEADSSAICNYPEEAAQRIAVAQRWQARADRWERLAPPRPDWWRTWVG